MQCPKCGNLNPDTVDFCTHCHATLRYTCPACKHVQLQGGKCQQCGIDFAKYALMVHFQAQTQANQDRERAKARSSLLKQILLLPLTGGLSLFKYFRSQLLGK